MKILVVSNLYPPHYVGGYELRCEVAVKALGARGHTVRVLTSNHGVKGAPAAADPDGGGPSFPHFGTGGPRCKGARPLNLRRGAATWEA